MNEILTAAELMANDEGYEAGIESQADKNPHADSDAEHRAWEAGYLQGQADRREIALSDGR